MKQLEKLYQQNKNPRSVLEHRTEEKRSFYVKQL